MKEMSGSPKEGNNKESSEVNSKSSNNASTSTNSDDEQWNSLLERSVLERSKSERSTRGDDNRRRRTIIVEKKNGTYGFTLQSYGIHYKREQEIEMVTYVDFVDYDGPAFKAGMREGDVILAINGHEMDRADHKTLVNFIKNCDSSRMRMVVSFEDCVRKVTLHMRYIELQRALQSRLNDLEKLCERERDMLMGRWKSHSLPARKRANGPSSKNLQEEASAATNLNSSTVHCCRPASSTEHLLLYSVYADGRSFLIPRNAACLVSVQPPRSRNDHHHFLTTNNVSSRHSYHQVNGLASSSSPTTTKTKHNQSTQVSSACLSAANGKNRCRQSNGPDGLTLDAYDLASPCCDPNCVPNRRREKQRRIRHDQQSHQKVQKHICPHTLSTDALYYERPTSCLQYVKPKSWDNLATKACGGYLDTGSSKTHSAERPKSSYSKVKATKPCVQRKCGSCCSSRYFKPTKSQECLLIPTTSCKKGQLDATLSCECLDGPNPTYILHPTNSLHSKHKRSTRHSFNNNSEITRL